MNVRLDAIRRCLEGVVPVQVATCSPEGMPNVAYLSQLQFVDDRHVAMSFQFFNTTRRNVLATGRATVLVVDPDTAAMYRLAVRYLRTETVGPLFENMKARLAGIASHTGMTGIFRLLGADVYRVLSIEAVPGDPLPPPPPPVNLLPGLRRACHRLAQAADLDAVLTTALTCLRDDFGATHASILMLDHARELLYTIASHGYAESGLGSEIPLGQGVIGVAARERTSIRITHMTSEYAYVRAVREGAVRSGEAGAHDTDIPLPGLASPGSQLAVPILARDELFGVLFLESPRELCFTYDDEDVLVILAGQLALAMGALHAAAGDDGETGARTQGQTPVSGGVPARLRYYPSDSSVFIDDTYLIKGIAGAIFWRLVNEYLARGRTDFSNRELRLDPRIGLPAVSDNLEARLVLLARRLDERQACVRIVRTGRGRFRIVVSRSLQLSRAGD